MLYIVRCLHDRIPATKRVRHWTTDIRASVVDAVGHAVGRRHWVAIGDFADPKAGARKARDRGCECAANRTEPRALRSVVASAMAGRKRRAPGNPGADRLCAVAYSAQYLRR